MTNPEQNESKDVLLGGAQKFFKWGSRSTVNVIKWITDNWLKSMVLIASATQTFALISFFAPAWAFWLPFIGVMLMEGAVPIWQAREQMADEQEGKGLSEKEKAAQERIANIMVWLCIFMTATTMIGGALVEVSTGQMAKILKPNETITAFMGWASIVGIFLLGSTHLIADWRYRRLDPMFKMKQEFRREQRRLLRIKNKVKLQDEAREQRYELKRLRELSRKEAPKRGRKKAEDNYGKEKK